MTSVLYDVPGPKAIRRNRILGAITVLVLIAIIGFVIWRLVETGQFTERKWAVFTYASVWQNMILPALGNTLLAFAVAAVGSLIFGILLAIGRLSDHRVVSVVVTWITEILRAVPVLVMMMLVYFGLPVLGLKTTPFIAVVAALIAYNGSVLAEVFRAGIESLPRGQGEAGYAIGLRKSGVMAFILFPQAVRVMMPVIIAQLVVTLKDTSLGSIITYDELLKLAKNLMSQDGRPIIPTTIVVSVIYISMCLLLSWVAHIVQKRVSASPKAIRLEADETAVMHEGTVTEVIAAQSTGKRPKR
ncbi:amino acid ABC transporter permease [Microbacterium sp. NC79]|uniref:amino acid ABC transporter permease n=1 Tax=Microbacterium sp. NC79 TaxID=2851009 RepID=UPI001C2BE85C|nr:amino acid ABC transporter permease [Microbacterium sp. NC79]MBV0895196.1 amino acid ABC transporter permease [Microbacterium sp. NC79]